jgi:hypothetical protein
VAGEVGFVGGRSRLGSALATGRLCHLAKHWRRLQDAGKHNHADLAPAQEHLLQPFDVPVYRGVRDSSHVAVHELVAISESTFVQLSTFQLHGHGMPLSLVKELDRDA